MNEPLIPDGYREVFPEKRLKLYLQGYTRPQGVKSEDVEAQLLKLVLTTQFGKPATEADIMQVEKLSIPGLSHGYLLVFQKVVFGTMFETFFKEDVGQTAHVSSDGWYFYWYAIKRNGELKLHGRD